MACRFEIDETGKTRAGSRQYRVACAACVIVISRATTSPVQLVNRHLREVEAGTVVPYPAKAKTVACPRCGGVEVALTPQCCGGVCGSKRVAGCRNPECLMAWTL